MVEKCPWKPFFSASESKQTQSSPNHQNCEDLCLILLPWCFSVDGCMDTKRDPNLTSPGIVLGIITYPTGILKYHHKRYWTPSRHISDAVMVDFELNSSCSSIRPFIKHIALLNEPHKTTNQWSYRFLNCNRPDFFGYVSCEPLRFTTLITPSTSLQEQASSFLTWCRRSNVFKKTNPS